MTKTILAGLLYLCCCFSLTAQDIFLEQVDSIKKLGIEKRIVNFQNWINKGQHSLLQQALLHHELGNAYFAKQDYLNAIQSTKTALDIRLAQDAVAPDTFLVSAFNLGIYHHDIGAYEQALSYYQMVVDRRPNRKVADALYQIGRTHTRTAEYQLGERAFASAEKEPSYVKTPYNRAVLLMEWADLYIEQDEAAAAQKAILLLKEAFDLFNTFPVKGKTANLVFYTLNRLGMAQSYAGQYPQAIQTFQQTLAFNQSCCQNIEFDDLIYTNLGIVYRRMGDLEKALDYHLKSLAICQELEEGKPDLYMASTYDNLATVLTQMERLDEALDHCQLALQWSLPTFSPASRLENPAKALIEGSPYKSDLLIFLHDKADALKKQAILKSDPVRFEAAVATYALCDQIIDWLRNEHLERSTKLYWRKRARIIYQSAVEACLKGQMAEEAFYFSEKSRAILLLDGLREMNAYSQLPDSVSHSLKELSDKISYLKKGIQKTGTQDTSGESLNKQLLFFQQEYQARLHEVETQFPEFYQKKYQGASLELVEFQSLLKKGVAFVEYFLTDDFALALVIDKERIRMVPLSPPQEWMPLVSQLVESFRSMQYNQPFPHDLPHSLFLDLISPIQPDLYQELIIVPDGILNLLPFEVLLTDQPDPDTPYKVWPFLLKKQSIRYAFSANFQMTATDNKHPSGNHKVLALAPMAVTDPAFGIEEKLQLPQNSLLVEGLDGLLPTDQFMGPTANRAVFDSLAASYSAIHLATHVILNHQQPERTHFLLVDKNNNTDLYYADELYKHHFNAELVVLSGCETGSGKIERGEGVASLGKAFAQNGCPNLAMSLWPVDDGATAQVLELFYQHLSAGKQKGEALRLAKLDYLENCSNDNLAHPFRWAGFIYYGDDQPLRLNRKKQQSAMILLGILGIGLVLMTTYICFKKYKKIKYSTKKE